MRVGAILLLVELFVAAPAFAQAVADGRSAYMRNQIPEAERIYRAVIASPTASARDRATAERELARIAWLINEDSKVALRHFEAARAIGDKPCDTASLQARVLRESQQSTALIRDGEILLGRCPEPDGQDAIRTHLLGAYLDRAATNPRDRAHLLEKARAEAGKFTPDADVEAARGRIETGLLTGDAPAALAAWKEYFWLDETDAPQALADLGVTQIFNQGLRNDAGTTDRLKLAELLMRTGFSRLSQRFAQAHGLDKSASDSPVWKRLQAYWTAREALDAALLAQNRRYARGGKIDAVLKAEKPVIEKANSQWMATLMAGAGETGDPKVVLKKAYGLVGTDVGSTDNYPGIHLGHVIEDRADRVTQYGKTANIRFMAIDNPVSNSFISWLFDGQGMVGGWQADGVIVHIRPGYVQSPLNAYRQSLDTEARRTLIERGTRLGAEDLAKLKERPIATLNGLNDRLQLQLVDRVAAVARTKSTDQASFRRAFLAEFSRANLDQSITKHEGRHAIDEALGISAKVEQPVLEYQAKLSELALTDYPRMALRNMNSNLEGSGMHDKAGAKVFDEYRKWMEAHTDQILGYDPSIPVLAQFDKLSDGQISEIARSLDPLPNGRPSPTKL